MMYGFQHWLRHTLSHVVHEESRDAMRYTRTITNPKEIMYVASRVQNCIVRCVPVAALHCQRQ